MSSDATNFQYLLEAIADKGSTLSAAQREILAGAIRLLGQSQLSFPRRYSVRYSVTVNYDQTVELLVKAGQYDWSNSDVASGHFPVNLKYK